MNKYVIERDIPGASKLSRKEIQGIAAKSNATLREVAAMIDPTTQAR